VRWVVVVVEGRGVVEEEVVRVLIMIEGVVVVVVVVENVMIAVGCGVVFGLVCAFAYAILKRG
jgi:uncharacterized membrane protein